MRTASTTLGAGIRRPAHIEPPVAKRRATSFEEILVVLAIPGVTILSRLVGDTDNSQGSSFPAQLMWAAIYCACTIAFLRSKVRNQLLRRSVALLVVLGVMLVSTAWSTNQVITFKNAIELVGTAAIAYYFASRYRLTRFVELLGMGIAGIALVSAAFVFVLHGALECTESAAGGWCGIYSDKNSLGAAMALGLITLVVAFFSTEGKQRVGIAVAMTLCAVMLVGSGSATAIICCAVALATYAFVALWNRPRFGPALTIGLLLSGAVALFVAVGIGEQVDPLSMLDRGSNLTGRVDFWPGLVDAIADRPILGYGYNAFFSAGGAESPMDTYLAGYLSDETWRPPHAHNGALQLALDAGAVGTIPFLVFLVVGTRRAVGLAARFRSDSMSIWPALTILFFVMENVTESHVVAYDDLLWTAFTCAILLASVSRPPEPQT